jgi:hypothetical protein
MSFFEDMFEGFRRRGHGRYGNHGHNDCYDDDHDRDYRPIGGPYGALPASRVASIACPKCNAAVPLMPGTRFCASCGGSLTAEPACGACGSKLGPGAAFCPGCGTKV